MATSRKRPYVSAKREEGAEQTRQRVLAAAGALFARRGIDRVTIAQVADRAKVAVPTVYALFRSKEGLLRALLESALFGPRFQAARARLEGVTDPVALVATSASVARAIYEGESVVMGLVRGASAFSPALRKVEQEFEALRLEMQEPRVRALFGAGKARVGLTVDEARRILWMYTSRDIYRMLVQEGGWDPDRYERWLAETLVSELVAPAARTGARNAATAQPRRGVDAKARR